VLFAGRKRARERAWEDGHYGSWLGQWLLQLTIGYGYGYRYFYALFWVAGLVALGTLVLELSGEAWRPEGRRIGVWYSLDMLLPIIQLRKWHYDIDFDGFPSVYFYVHKMMGYVLASFLIAGLSGLTR
jgi:hypothetical protein